MGRSHIRRHVRRTVTTSASQLRESESMNALGRSHAGQVPLFHYFPSMNCSGTPQGCATRDKKGATYLGLQEPLSNLPSPPQTLRVPPTPTSPVLLPAGPWASVQHGTLHCLPSSFGASGSFWTRETPRCVRGLCKSPRAQGLENVLHTHWPNEIESGHRPKEPRADCGIGNRQKPSKGLSNAKLKFTSLAMAMPMAARW